MNRDCLFMDERLFYLDPREIKPGDIVYVEFTENDTPTRVQGTVTVTGPKHITVSTFNYVTGEKSGLTFHPQEMA